MGGAIVKSFYSGRYMEENKKNKIRIKLKDFCIILSSEVERSCWFRTRHKHEHQLIDIRFAFKLNFPISDKSTFWFLQKCME